MNARAFDHRIERTPEMEAVAIIEPPPRFFIGSTQCFIASQTSSTCSKSSRVIASKGSGRRLLRQAPVQLAKPTSIQVASVRDRWLSIDRRFVIAGEGGPVAGH